MCIEFVGLSEYFWRSVLMYPPSQIEFAGWHEDFGNSGWIIWPGFLPAIRLDRMFRLEFRRLEAVCLVRKTFTAILYGSLSIETTSERRMAAGSPSNVRWSMRPFETKKAAPSRWNQSTFRNRQSISNLNLKLWFGQVFGDAALLRGLIVCKLKRSSCKAGFGSKELLPESLIISSCRVPIEGRSTESAIQLSRVINLIKSRQKFIPRRARRPTVSYSVPNDRGCHPLDGLIDCGLLGPTKFLWDQRRLLASVVIHRSSATGCWPPGNAPRSPRDPLILLQNDATAGLFFGSFNLIKTQPHCFKNSGFKKVSRPSKRFVQAERSDWHLSLSKTSKFEHADCKSNSGFKTVSSVG